MSRCGTRRVAVVCMSYDSQRNTSHKFSSLPQGSLYDQSLFFFNFQFEANGVKGFKWVAQLRLKYGTGLVFRPRRDIVVLEEAMIKGV